MLRILWSIQGPQPTFGFDRSASALGSAILCQLQWSTPNTRQITEAVVCKNRALARRFIWRTQADILRHLTIAFRGLMMTETRYLEGDA